MSPGDASRGGSLDDPKWEDIENLLSRMGNRSGSITLWPIDGPEIGPAILQVVFDRGNFMLMLGFDDGEDYDVRTYDNGSDLPGKIILGGDFWDRRSVCRDPEIVARSFRELFELGDVSRELLR